MPFATLLRPVALLAALVPAVAAQPSGAVVFDPQTGEPIPAGLEAPPVDLPFIEPDEALTLRQHLPSGSTKLVRVIDRGPLTVRANYVFQDGASLLSVAGIIEPGDDPIRDRFTLPAQPSDMVIRDGLAYTALTKNGGLLILDVSDIGDLQEVGDAEGRSLLAVALDADAEFAFAGAGSAGIVVYDVSAPANPEEVALIDTPGSANGAAIADTVLYVATGTDGLRVYGISDPTQPVEIGAFSTDDSFATYVAVRGTVAWLTGAFGLIALDVTQPDAPREIGRFSAGGETTYEIAFDGTTAYLAGLDGLRTLDVTDPAAITETEFFPASQALSVDLAGGATGGSVLLAERFKGLRVLGDDDGSLAEYRLFENGGFAHKPFFDDETLYVTDLGGRLRIFDASGSDAVETARIDVPPSTQEVFVVDGLAYVTDAAGEASGLTILDVSDPADLTVVGSYASGPAFGLDVERAGDTVTVYLANDLNGLAVLDASDPANVTELGTYPVGASAVDVETIDLRQSGLIAYVVSFGEGIFALDVSDPTDIVQRDAEPSWGFLNAIHLSEDTGAYVADGQEGIREVALFPPDNIRTSDTHSVITQARDVTATIFIDIDVLFDVVYVADDFFGLLRFDHGFFGDAGFASSDRGIGVATNRKGFDDAQNLLALTAGDAGVYLIELPPFPVDNEDGAAAGTFALSAPFPNPVRDAATLRFSLPDAADVTLAVYDVLGRRVAVLADGLRASGPHEVSFDASGLPGGVYLVRLSEGARHTTQRLVVVR
jgi:hypothetical protein